MNAADAARRHSLFAVPLHIARIDNVTPVLTAVAHGLIAERESDPGLQRSNTGGWHSRPDLCGRNDPVLGFLFQRVVDEIDRLHADLAAALGVRAPDRATSMQAWATIMLEGDYVVTHDHAQAHWSFVLYLDPGDTGTQAHPKSGAITWLNPAAARVCVPGLDYAPDSFELHPQAGDLVIFPGWLRHFVHPYRGVRPRVAIAGNACVEVA